MDNLNLEEYESNQYEFLQNFDRSSLLFVRYFHIVCLAAWLFVLIIDILEGENNTSRYRLPTFSLYYGLPIIGSSALLVYLYWRKKALKIVFKNKIFTIYNFFGKKQVKHRLEELKFAKITLSSIVFNFKDGNVISFWGDNFSEDIEFIKRLNIPIHWSFMAKKRFK